MPSYCEKFEAAQHNIRMHKLALNIRRSLTIQARNKIKPSSMNPVLLNKPNGLRGGDVISDEPGLDFYYPTTDTTGEGEADCVND